MFSVVSQYFGAEKTGFSYQLHQFEDILCSNRLQLTGDTAPVMFFFIPLHPDFVTPDDGLKPVVFTEPLCDVWPEL